MKKYKLSLVIVAMLCVFANINYAQSPNLRSASHFALFTSLGAFNNVGVTKVTGNIGTNAGAFTGFPPGEIVGQIHVVDSASLKASTDVDLAYTYVAALTCGSVIGTTLGNNQVLTPNVYCTGVISTLSGNLILDAQGDPNALFIFQIDAAFSTSIASNVILINSTSLNNIYWQVNGAVTLGDSSSFKGTIIANGAINLLANTLLMGRALSRQGAITVYNSIIEMPSVNPLPITLIAFNAEKNSNQFAVDISWQTASEFNSAYFLVERSTDGVSFKTIGKYEAMGYSSQLVSYFFMDEKPVIGVNYYRLNQFDLDGVHKFSSEKAVRMFYNSLAVTIFPNPFTELINIKLHNTSLSINSQFILYNTVGQEVMRINILAESTSIIASKLLSGLYFYRFVSDDVIVQSGKLTSQ